MRPFCILHQTLNRLLMDKKKCSWCMKDKLYQDYHDEEWGIPVHDDRALFECLLLEGAQAGLSWYTVLKKRAHYRIVFDGFDPQKMAKYDQTKREALLSDAGIIRNKLKVNAFIVNAQLYLEMKAQGEHFSKYLWGFVNHKTIINDFSEDNWISTSPESDAMSKDLKKRGFKFVGSTICYAFMQAVGMVDDHMDYCWRRSK